MQFQPHLIQAIILLNQYFALLLLFLLIYSMTNSNTKVSYLLKDFLIWASSMEVLIH